MKKIIQSLIWLKWPFIFVFVALSLYSMGMMATITLFDWLPKQEKRVSKHLGIEYKTDELLPDFLETSHSRLREMQNRSGDWPELKRRPLQAFINRHSIRPGEAFDIRLARHPELEQLSGHLEIWRLGQKREKIDSSPVQEIPAGELFADSAAVGFSWEKSPWQPDTSQWKSGLYQVDFVNQAGDQFRDIAFVVVTNPDYDGDILIKLSTNTWAAYNAIGGHNLYRSRTFGSEDNGRGQMVSFDRPLKLWDFHSARTWATGYIRWIEKVAQARGWQVDYAGNFDIHNDKNFSQKYPLLITVGHDEYWTLEEYQAMWERHYTHGKSTLFLSANTAYWQVRYSDIHAPDGAEFRGRQMICFKSMDDIIRFRSPTPRLHVTSRYRDDNRMPENALMGVAFDSFSKDGSYGDFMVANTDLPFFENTGLVEGDTISKIVGHEWDNREPIDELWDQSKKPLLERPNFDPQVIFRAEMQTPKGEPSLAEAVYYETEAGAKVFSAGVNSWVWGVGRRQDKEGDPRFQKLNENMLEYMLRPVEK